MSKISSIRFEPLDFFEVPLEAGTDQRPKWLWSTGPVGQSLSVPPQFWWSPVHDKAALYQYLDHGKLDVEARSVKKYLQWLGYDQDYKGPVADDVAVVPAIFRAKLVVESDKQPIGWITRIPPADVQRHRDWHFAQGLLQQLSFRKTGKSASGLPVWEADVEITLDSPASWHDTWDALARIEAVVMPKDDPTAMTATSLRFRLLPPKIYPKLNDSLPGFATKTAKDVMKREFEELVRYAIGFDEATKIAADILKTAGYTDPNKKAKSMVHDLNRMKDEFSHWIDFDVTEDTPEFKELEATMRNVTNRGRYYNSYLKLYTDISEAAISAFTKIFPAFLSEYIAKRLAEPYEHPLTKWLNQTVKASEWDELEKKPVSFYALYAKYPDVFMSQDWIANDVKAPSVLNKTYSPDSPWAWEDGYMYWWETDKGDVYVLYKADDGSVHPELVWQEASSGAAAFLEDWDKSVSSQTPAPPAEAPSKEQKEAPKRAELSDVETGLKTLFTFWIAKAEAIKIDPESLSCRDVMSSDLSNALQLLTGSNIPNTELGRLRQIIQPILKMREECQKKFKECADLAADINKGKYNKLLEEHSPQSQWLYDLITSCIQFRYQWGPLPFFFRSQLGYGLYKIMELPGLLKPLEKWPERSYLSARERVFERVYRNMLIIDNEPYNAEDVASRLDEIKQRALNGTASEADKEFINKVLSSSDVQYHWSALYKAAQAIGNILGISSAPYSEDVDITTAQQDIMAVESSLDLSEVNAELSYILGDNIKLTPQDFHNALTGILYSAFQDAAHKSKTDAGALTEFLSLIHQLDESKAAELIAKSATVSWGIDKSYLIEASNHLLDQLFNEITAELQSGKKKLQLTVPEELRVEGIYTPGAGQVYLDLTKVNPHQLLGELYDLKATLAAELTRYFNSVELPEELDLFKSFDISKPISRKQARAALEKLMQGAMSQVFDTIAKAYGERSPYGMDRIIEWLKYQFYGYTVLPIPLSERRPVPFYPYVVEAAHVGQRAIIRSAMAITGASLGLLAAIIGR